MEEVLSLEFPVTTPEGEVVLLLPQISLSRGLERTFDFSAGNEEGRKVTEEYINYTFEYYTIRKEKEKISQSENPKHLHTPFLHPHQVSRNQSTPHSDCTSPHTQTPHTPGE